MFWLIIAVLILIFLTWSFYIKPYSYWKKLGVPQTKPWIFLGDTWPTVFRRKIFFDWTEWLYYMYPESSLTGFYQFTSPFLMLRSPELIKQVCVKDFDHFTDHNGLVFSEDIDPIFAKNLLLLKGQKWRDMRSLLSRSFTSSKMKIIYQLISKESEKFVAYFAKKKSDQLEVELKDVFTRYTNDVIASTAFGIEVKSLENPENELLKMGKALSNQNALVALLKFFLAMISPRLFKLLGLTLLPNTATISSIINETVNTREKEGIVRPDMINILLEEKRGIQSNKDAANVVDSGFAVVEESTEYHKPQKKQIEITNTDIIAQSLLFFLAGFDTVSTALSYTCYELAINPDIQNKLRKEIEDQTNNETPSYEDILEMSYLDMVISESLRKWPPALATDRLCIKPYTIKSGTPNGITVNLKKGDTIWIPIYNLHRDPKYYPNPEKFDPERYSEENKEKIVPYTYLPFGVGPRACIGSRFALLELKSILCHLLKSFEIVPTEKTQIPLKWSTKSTNLMPEKGFCVGFRQI